MSQHAGQSGKVEEGTIPGGGGGAVYLSPMAQRRTEFEAACAGLFERLALADGIEAARALVMASGGQDAGSAVDLLVIDLERFEQSIDLPALGELVALRRGAPVLLLCPCAGAAWVPALMAFGPASYAITPAEAPALRAAVADARAAFGAGGADVDALRALLALRSRAGQAVRAAVDSQDLGERLCRALAEWPGVLHAALFHLKPDGDLQLDAQHGPESLSLAALLGRSHGLLQAPLRHAFPGLLAAATGELALLDTLGQSGEPAMADTLRAHGVATAAGIAIPADGPGMARGALSLLFDRARPLSQEDFATLLDVAELAAQGLHGAELALENEQLLAKLTYISTTDALTGIANRRHGEHLLEQEIRRARRYRVPLALVAFDIDRFKAINDNFGYPVGDVVLRSVADAARAVLRSSDLLVRSGGEEFQIIAPHTSAIDGLKMAEKIRLAIEQAEVPGADHVTVSLGVAQLGEQESGDSLVQRVNAALARAKRAGRNCVELAMQ